MSNLSQMPVSMKGFFLNTEQRCPVTLILDTSGSMHGAKIDQLNTGLQAFLTAVRADALAAKRVELAIVTFGGAVETVQAFNTVDKITPPVLDAEGETPMGAAITEAFRITAERQALYRQAGIASYQPWYLLITDGEPTDDIASAVPLIANAEKARKGAFYAIGVDGADMGVLRSLSVRPTLELDGINFTALFQWLSVSLGVHSRSPGTTAPQLPQEQGKAAAKTRKKGAGR